jgi:hypothetical protein
MSGAVKCPRCGGELWRTETVERFAEAFPKEAPEDVLVYLYGNPPEIVAAILEGKATRTQPLSVEIRHRFFCDDCQYPRARRL